MKRIFLFVLFLWVGIAHASIYISMYSTQTGRMLGVIKADDTIYGLLLTPRLRGLTPGIHGFHFHTCPSCASEGMAAAGHLDPSHTDEHKGPYRGNGHLGDLPVLIINNRGIASLPVLAPRLKLNTIKNHALIIHAGADNYSDKPKPMGGGGVRVACGIVPYF